ncbi:MAG: tRNA threonylcarbamoyladenosine biosynthesis protein RimN [Cycloclasticus sp. symbiont of Poecilosclerida sp. N]|nr:MAG: tRNA threonylcarbamoyladenosine biosynthesis protein RimN [Cycloclasticus sp. symbiont of Poecilosclerida sp. N]
MPSAWQKRRFVECVHRGGVVAYPTESVFGLGCDPLNAKAVFELLTIKGRSQKKGLILIASDFFQVSPYLKTLPKSLIAKLEDVNQEPVTYILPAKESVPKWLTGQHKTLAIRLVQHDLAKQMCELAGIALVSSSANESGGEALKTAHKTRLKFARRGVFVLNGNVGGAKKPSRIIDPLTNKQLR